MSKLPTKETIRERQIICGLFLSKFDLKGLEYLGFENFAEAFNALGYGLGARPASIKNYRDELDPFFPNKRMGWHKRRIRDHCRIVVETYGDLDIIRLGNMVKAFLLPNELQLGLEDISEVLEEYRGGQDSSFAKRLITGRAAEQYFLENYSSMPEFGESRLTNTTHWGCGFDFKLSPPDSDIYMAVEVKGLRNRTGQIQLTDLEHQMADRLSDRFYLVLIRNFAEIPFHSVIRDPLRCGLDFNRVERKEIRVTWSTNVL